SYSAMVQRMQAVIGTVLKDPAVASVGSQIGASGTTTLNDGRMFIDLKPQSERTASADQIINRLRPQLAKIQGMTLYMQAAQDIPIGGRETRTREHNTPSQRRRTTPSAAEYRERSTNTRSSTPTPGSSTTGPRSSWRNSRESPVSPMSPATRRMPARSSTSRSTAMQPQAMGYCRRRSTTP